MKRLRPVIVLLCATLSWVVGARAGPVHRSVAPPAEFPAGASGAQLVQALVPAGSRTAAFRELRRRTAKPGHQDRGSDEEVEPEPETIVCPQSNGEDPLYLVLYKFLPATVDPPGAGYPVAGPAELFPPEPVEPGDPVATARPALARRADLAIAVFNARGEEVTPFGGGNMLADGIVADFTGDGRIARGDVINFGVAGVKEAQVLVVSAVEAPAARPLLAVLYNWGENANWGYEFVPRPEDGTIDVRFGPVTDAEAKRIDPKVTWRWDPARYAFTGPAEGGSGEHFLALESGAKLFDAVDALKGRLPFFAGGPPPASSPAPSPVPAGVAGGPTSGVSPSAAPPSPARAPVPASFLDGLSDETILRFFDEGRNASLEAGNALQRQTASIALPANFWSAPAREVALALADLNRTPAHRERYRLAVDDRDGAAPPKEGAIIFSTGSSRYYRAADTMEFLPFGPGDDPVNLLYLGSLQAGAVFRDVVGSQPAFDLRRFALPAADSRQLAAVLWWLDRVRSRARSGRADDALEDSFSTADGYGTLQLVSGPGKARPLRLSGTLWSGGMDAEPNPVAARWTGNYDRETALNLISRLIDEALPARLGEEWSRSAPREEPDIGPDLQSQTPRYPPQELARLHDVATRALAISPQGQRRISYALLGGIVAMTGDLGFDDLAPALRNLVKQLPSAAPGHAGRTTETIWREMEAAEPDPLGPDPLADETPADRAKEERRQALSREWEGVVDGTDEPGAAGSLRGGIQTALKQLASVRDPRALAANATDPSSPGAPWSLQQLRRMGENSRAATVLEGWLQKSENDGTGRRQIFASLAELAPERARRVAEAVPADVPGDPLCVPAFVLLAGGGGKVPQGATRQRTLLAIVVDPEMDPNVRHDAIAALVPDDSPARYPDPKIDVGLRRLLDEPALVTKGGFADDYLVSTAANALAKRGDPADFDRILALLTGSGNADPILTALVVLLPQCDEAAGRKLEAFLRNQLTSKTNMQVSSLVYAAWLTGRRGLRPEIRGLATAGPQEVESARANRYGGDPVPLAGERFHVARQVAALWEDEAGAAIRARALFAFATHYNVTNDPEKRDRFVAELSRLAPALSAADHKAIDVFLDLAVKSSPAGDEPARTPAGQPKANALRQLVRTTPGF